MHAPTATLSEFYVTIRTGNGVDEGTNDRFHLCLADNTSWNLDNPEIDDRQTGAVDHYRPAGKGLTKAKLDRVLLQATNGTNAWMPTCVAVVGDGELMYCQDGLSAKLSTQGGSEKPSWQAANPKLVGCGSCYPGGKLIQKPMIGHTSANSTRLWLLTSAAGASVDVAISASDAAALDSAGAPAKPPDSTPPVPEQ